MPGNLNDETCDGQVSWVRLPDWRIIASGRHVYENGKDGHRFRVLTNQRQEIDEDGQAAPGSSPGTEWTLQIRFSSLADGGLYDCQVSTGTGVVTHHFNVSVVVPTTTIVGGVGGEYHVDKGSAIRLSCLIHNVRSGRHHFFEFKDHPQDRFLNNADPAGAAVHLLVPQRPDDQLRRQSPPPFHDEGRPPASG